MSFFNKDTLLLYWKAVSNNKSFKFGAPFILLVLGGSAFLKQFTSLRYEYSSISKHVAPEEMEGLRRIKKPEEVTLESVYEELKQVDIDNWTNKRGPRPWEDPEESQTKS